MNGPFRSVGGPTDVADRGLDQRPDTTVNSVSADHPRALGRPEYLGAQARSKAIWRFSSGWVIGLAVLITFQAVLLHSFAARDVAQFLPRSYDQSGYLTDSYRVYEDLRARGLTVGLIDAFTRPAPQGVLLVPLAALAYAVSGAGRITALDLNILAFLVYLVVTAWAVGRALGPRSAAVAVGLILSIRSTFAQAGGVADFRYDFVAMCIWGILLALTLYPIRGSRWLRPVVVTSVVGLLLVSIRMITAAYVVPLYAMAAGLAWGARRVRAPFQLNDTRPFGPTLVPVLIWLSGFALLLAMNLRSVLDYYVRGHITSSEKAIRASEVGVTDLLQSLTYYPRSVTLDHLTPMTDLVLLACVGFGTIVAVAHAQSRTALRTNLERLAFLGLAVAIPYVALTTDEAKSPVVGNIFVPTLILIAALFFGIAEAAAVATGRVWLRRALTAGAIAVVGFGITSQLDARLAAVTPLSTQSSSREAGRLALTGGDYVAQYLDGKATWSIDAHYDYTGIETIMAYYYEQRGQLLELTGTVLGHGSVDQVPTNDDILSAAKASDILILTRQESLAQPSEIPADNGIAAMSSQLRDYAESSLTSLGDFELFGQTLTLYARPAIPIHGLSGPWITSAGVDLLLPPVSWSPPTCLTLQGTSNLTWLPARPEVTSTYRTRTGGQTFPTTFDAEGDSYRIQVQLTQPVTRANGALHLDFSTNFVPAELKVSADQRQLVVLGPTSTRLTPGPCTPGAS
ncbi:MAG: hypothetical protein JOY61_05305 [Chloroflexi bacterium]|nr:hypothetical protein [Chloroflexota bacterium]